MEDNIGNYEEAIGLQDGDDYDPDMFIEVSQARAEGFQDCEDLIIAWLERKAAEKPRGRMGFELRSAALAIKLGEHRSTGRKG